MSALSGDDFYYMCQDPTCKNYGTDKCWGSYGCPNYEKIQEEEEVQETENKKYCE